MAQAPAIYSAPPSEEMSHAIEARLWDRVEGDPALLAELLSDAVYLERMRMESDREDEGYVALIDETAAAVTSGDAAAQRAAAKGLVQHYVAEIHNRFSGRTYSMATRVLPGALTRLVTAATPKRLASGDVDPDSRLVLHGPIEKIRGLVERGVVLFTPTHLSNLDSPLLGYAIYRVNLPPVSYGAGLNLFSNPVMAFFMSRLGAYTVDRRKQCRIYKNVLKDYSVELMRRGFHSLFFPGGTRSRSGQIEKHVKKGLLGTAIQAWQENLDLKVANPDVFVVPMTLSTSLVLEAETLIRDALASEGKSRYIIEDDEFSKPRTVASFLSRVLNLDEGVHITFSEPLDVLGNPVDAQGRSLGPDGQVIDRTRYVTDAQGTVQWDPQRDRVYTDRLADRIVKAFHRDSVALPTHVVAFAAWQLLADLHPGLDTWRLVRLNGKGRRVQRSELLLRIEQLSEQLTRMVDNGEIKTVVPAGAQAMLDQAIHHFSSFHSRPVLANEGDELRVDPELALFYRNRLVGYGLGESA